MQRELGILNNKKLFRNIKELTRGSIPTPVGSLFGSSFPRQIHKGNKD